MLDLARFKLDQFLALLVLGTTVSLIKLNLRSSFFKVIKYTYFCHLL